MAHEAYEKIAAAFDAAAVFCRTERPVRAWDDGRQKRRLIRAERGRARVEIVARGCFGSVNSVAPLDYVQVDFKDASLS